MFYFGAAYYPELWDKAEIDKDIKIMKEYGLNCMRVGEFAWSTMEKTEGVYDFSIFKYVADKLYENGIYTIMCTPSCTPPRWFFKKYPNALRTVAVGNSRERQVHRARVHTCKSNKDARRLNAKIAEEMAKAFAGHPGVIGWQIDNELFPYDDGCYCPDCVKGFREFLKEKYGTIENLNRSWGTYRWSLDYESFDDIEPPHTYHWENPSRFVDWGHFQCNLIYSYTNEQAEAIRKYSSAPIGTDMMTNNYLSYRDMNKTLDIVQYNHYDNIDILYRNMFVFDFLRKVKERPFWVTETLVGWNGGYCAANDYHHIDSCYMNTISPICKGGEMNLFWLFRAHPNGHELGHGSIITSAGRPYSVSQGIKRAAEHVEKSKSFLENSKIQSKIALTYSTTAVKNFKHAPLTSGRLDLNYRERLIDTFHAPLKHYNVDVIETDTCLDGYEILLSPMLAHADECGFKERVTEWVKNGGTWIVGPLSDIMTDHGSKYTDAPFSFLEELGGVYTKYNIPFDDQVDKLVKTHFVDNGQEIKTSINYDAFETVDSEALAVYTGGEDFDGLAAITRRKVGKGQVIILGTGIDGDALIKLIDRTPIAKASDNIELIERSGKENGIIALELGGKDGYVVLCGEYYDILGEKTVSGRVELKPFEALFLKKAD